MKRKDMFDDEGLILSKCTLDPKGNGRLRNSLRVTSECSKSACLKCGWNRDVAAKRAAEDELKYGKM